MIFRLLFLLFSVAFFSSAAEKPNFLIIMLDDSGWTDFGCYGSQIDTPNIDQFAREGMRFTDCHSAAPNCSPARAGLLTGRTPSRVGMYSYRPVNHPMHLLDKEFTIAELLKENGYRTGHFGKWHLSTLLSEDQADPADQGFEYSLGTDNNAAPSHLDPVNFVRNGKAVSKIEGYSCQIVVDEAMGWLDNIGKDDPFFACVWYHEPHTPIASPPELVEKYKKKYPKLSNKDAQYYANIENVDIATGRLLKQLEEKGIADDTFIFITSDNGGLNNYSNRGIRGKKSNVWEGGHRVPGIFRWPGKIAPRTECDVPICGIDIFPTICDIAGIDLPKDRKIDGTSIASLLTGKSDSLTRETPLYWFFYRLNPALALRDGKWSLIAETDDSGRPKTHGLIKGDMPYIKGSRPEKFILYDLSEDQAQKKDVSDEHPEVFERLKKQMIEMHSDVISESPTWEIPEYKTSKPKIWNSY